MTTMFQTIGDAVADIIAPGVPHAATRAYKESVFSGQCDETILADARKLETDWQRDRAVYERRLAACEALTEKLPALEEAAVEAGETAREAAVLARASIPDDMTVAQLRARLVAAGYSGPTATASKLARALPALRGHAEGLKSREIRAESIARECREQAKAALIQTAGSLPRDSETDKLAGQIVALKSRMAENDRILRAESQVARAKSDCEALGRGDRLEFSSAPQQNAPLGMLYRRSRAKLDQLLALVARKPDAESANAVDAEELAQLQSQLAEAQRENLLRLCEPENMRWVGDE